MSNGWTSINVIILEYREKIGGRGWWKWIVVSHPRTRGDVITKKKRRDILLLFFFLFYLLEI